MIKQTRNNPKYFLAKTVDGPVNHLSKGISYMGGNHNAREITLTYINDSPSSTIRGGQAEWSVEGNIFWGDPASDLLHEMATHRAKGDDAIVYMVIVTDQEEGTESGSFSASRQQCNFAATEEPGDITFSGSLKVKGGPVHGKATVSKDLATGFETCTFICSSS